MNYYLMEQQLEGSYREAFKKAQFYASMNGIAEDFSGERLEDLYDLLITAQSEKKPCERITGKDPDLFFHDLFSDYSIKDTLNEIPKKLYTLSCILLVLELLTVFASDDGFFGTSTEIVPYLFGLLFGGAFTLFCRFIIYPLSKRYRSISTDKMNSIATVVFIAAFTLCFALVNEHFKEVQIPAAPLIIVSGAYFLIYLAVRSLMRYKRYGTVRDERKALRKKQDSELMYKSDRSILLRSWEKYYTRLTAKGKTTEEEFLGLLKKEIQKESGADKFMTAVLILIFAGAIALVIKDGTPLPDLLVFASLVGAAEYFVGRAFIREIRRQHTIKKDILRECEESGMTMPAYIASVLKRDDDTPKETEEAAT